ncbi:MAG: mechanosensitive ion channel family protein, partial [Nonomuraea sp.]|nr:mechanosensitive ion channel family protein [Nonomuraea sp.]
LRWRIKRAFDAADIRIVGGATAPPEEELPDPNAAVAPPSVFANTESPQAAAASPIVQQRPPTK